MTKVKLTIMLLAVSCSLFVLTGCRDIEKEKAMAEAISTKAELAKVKADLATITNERDNLKSEPAAAKNLKFENGNITWMSINGRDAYIIQPKASVDSQRRWVWIVPGWLGTRISVPNLSGIKNVDYEFYIEPLLAKGFHIVGVDTGPTLGSPAGAKAFGDFYDLLIHDYKLSPKSRLIGTSNGALIAYAWAFRHPEKVDLIFGIFPALDLRSWPGLEKVVGPNSIGDPVFGFREMKMDELQNRLAEFNPIDNLKPLADHNVKIFLVHGDADQVVPIASNSLELEKRYKAMNGAVEIEIVSGGQHETSLPFYKCQRGLEFISE